MTGSPGIHAMTIDVEDWYQSTIDANASISDRFVASTERVLEMLQEQGVRGTFFVLGLAAEKAPHLVRRIAEAGHEVQSHGYGHQEVFKLTRQQFHDDVVRARSLLEDLAGREVVGYRAPSFSIDERTPWAWDVLAETGHQYDSSVFPIKMRRYGIDNYPAGPHIVSTPAGRKIVEAPVAFFTLLGRRMPCAGGGYVRLLPRAVLRAAWRQIDRSGRPGILYMHPYEYDPSELSQHSSSVSVWRRLHQGIGRKGFPGKIKMLVQTLKFSCLAEVLSPWLRELTCESPS